MGSSIQQYVLWPLSLEGNLVGRTLKNLARFFALAGLGFALTNCKEINAAKKGEHAVVSNCFTQLYPARIVRNQIQKIAFQNGACIGEYHALNRISFQDKVVISQDGFSLAGGIEAFLTVDRDVVIARSSAGSKRIGTLDPKTYAIRTDPGVEFALMVSDFSGSMMQWNLESGGPQEQTQEEIVIHIPY